ncbi:MAG: thiosulfate sulfurtransferase [Verrucomicrobiaceae bacterium]|nr:thiosulfate sulfurtransferase [Verrucomicrobiaceae bacterium]
MSASLPSLPLLLEPDALEPLLDHPDLLILDASSAANYQRGHVPNAIHIAPQALQNGIQPAVGKLPSVEQLSALFASVGLTPDKHVIAYDDEGGGWAGRLLWTLEVLGHHRYSYLNGGLPAWANEGHPLEADASVGVPSQFVAQIHPESIATLDYIRDHLGDHSFAVWDARSPDEYVGRKVVAARGGHIPGAINLDWIELMDRRRNLRLLPLEVLSERLQALGLTPDKTIVTHCQTHHRSGLTWLAMKVLGYPDIKGYDGSWGEWGNRSDTPVDLSFATRTEM